MDQQIEELIVARFFQKVRRDRILFELNNPKYRNAAFNRLCHNYLSLLIAKYMVQIQPPNSDPAAIAELLKQRGAGNLGYLLFPGAEVDGSILPLAEALQHVMGLGPAIVSSVHGRLAYFEPEDGQLPPNRFLLMRSD